MINNNDDDNNNVDSTTTPTTLLDPIDLRRVCASICTSPLIQLAPVTTHAEAAVRHLVRRDTPSLTRRHAISQLTSLVAALHARERSAPGGDVSLSTVLGDDALVALVHAIATRAVVREDDDAVVHDALALLVALLEAQFARPAAGAYWSRQFFFECDFAESLIAVLLRESLKKAPPPPPPGDELAQQVQCAPLALHALAALCNARPIENADENAVDQLSRTALRVRALSDVRLLDALTAAIDDGLKRCLRFYTAHTRPITNEADENVFDRLAGWLAAPFAYLTGVPVDGYVPDEPSSHHEVRDTAAALAVLFELLKSNDAWCARLLVAHDEATAIATTAATTGAATGGVTSPRLLRRLLLLSSFVFGDAQDARSLLYASVCAALLERVVLRPALFVRLASDTEPLLLFTLTSNSSGAATPLVGLAPVLATLAQVLYRARSGPLALDTLTRVVRALLAVLRVAREQRCTVQWTRFASLWRAALTLLQRLAPLRVSAEARCLCILTLQLLNDAITFGNTFLPTAADYDALFYELLLQRGALEDVFHAVDLSDNAPERQALRAQLVNLRIIVTHFSTLLMSISEYDDANAVLRVIQRGMQSLKLRLLAAARSDDEEQRRERQLMHRFVSLAVADVVAPAQQLEDQLLTQVQAAAAAAASTTTTAPSTPRAATAAAGK